jgi:tetratricopeptide (TPR) repeat protein
MTTLKKEHPHYIRGDALDLLKAAAHAYQAKDFDKVWRLANKVLSDYPDNAQALYLMGQCCLSRDWQGLAYNLFRRSTALRPEMGQNWLGFGATALDMRRWDEAESCMQKAMELLPTEPIPVSNMATIRLNQGRPKECIEWADKALALMPAGDAPHITLNKGFAYLMLKDWANGFEGFRHNVLSKGRKRRVYRIPEEPDWDGSPGQTVVVQCEQGLGDEIAAMSIVRDLARVSKQVIVDTHPKLINLFRRSFPEVVCYGTRKEHSVDWPHDYQIDATVQVSALGYWFRKADADFPRKPWLVPCPDLRAKWREWLEQFPGQHCGIAWTGGMWLTNRNGRSVTLEDFDQIMMNGATYFSLEYRDDEAAVEAWNQANPLRKVIRPPIDASDYDDTIAFLAELDYVITATTTIVHACGAMGRQAACFVPREIMSSQWRYGIEGDDIIWYPPDSVRLYRQGRSEADMKMALYRIAKDWHRTLALREKVAA